MAARAHVDPERLEHLANDGFLDEAAPMAFHCPRTIARHPLRTAISPARFRSNHDLVRVAHSSSGPPAPQRRRIDGDRVETRELGLDDAFAAREPGDPVLDLVHAARLDEGDDRGL